MIKIFSNKFLKKKKRKKKKKIYKNRIIIYKIIHNITKI